MLVDLLWKQRTALIKIKYVKLSREFYPWEKKLDFFMFESALYWKFLFQFGMETFSKVFTNPFRIWIMFSPSSNTYCVFCSLFFWGQILRTGDHPLYLHSKFILSSSFMQSCWVISANHVDLHCKFKPWRILWILKLLFPHLPCLHDRFFFFKFWFSF